MSADREREEEIFDVAREIASADEQAAYLARMCGGNSELRERIEGMLKADAAAGEFFNRPEDPRPTILVEGNSLAPSIEKAGERIGRYKLLQQIGEGGMGVVYMAEQEEPVRRTGALKIIKLGLDTREVVARFEAERQALAMMDQPHIAKVLDAGATNSGRPYFVMELVRGIPLTEYCDKNCLPIMLTKWAIIEIASIPGRTRKAVVELEGKSVGFWLDPDDHPEMHPGTESQTVS